MPVVLHDQEFIVKEGISFFIINSWHDVYVLVCDGTTCIGGLAIDSVPYIWPFQSCTQKFENTYKYILNIHYSKL